MLRRLHSRLRKRLTPELVQKNGYDLHMIHA